MQTASVHQMPSTTAGFIRAIDAYLERRDFRARGDEVFAWFLFYHMKKGLERGHINNHEYTGIWHHLPTYVREAFDFLRTGEDRHSQYYREMYIKDTECEHIPDLVEIAFGGVERAVTISSLAHLMGQITGQEWIPKKILTYFMAQDTVLAQVFDEFCVRVYRRGLLERVDESKSSTMSGLFGTVHLRTFVSAGRIMMTFAREVEGQKFEDSVTFVGVDGDREGVRTGQQSVYCNLTTACGLIREVMEHWSADVDEQRRIFKDDEKVSMF